ncbi:MAG: VaFE repeat-containing surface-anchored protein, partial [Methanobrevibacter sp.]|nr:VaFE repeat-containing surface-anchored protein [Methanobrevibacter sp.]
VNGVQVKASKTFVAESVDGSVELEFTFDATGLGGKTLVVFEKLFYEGNEITSHEDLNDANQTITFKKDSKEGNDNKGEGNENNLANEGTNTNSDSDDESEPTDDSENNGEAESNSEEETNNEKTITKANAGSMKSTGIPIAILLILAVLGLVTYRRKQ